MKKANELHLTRVLEAPVREVWAAWTDPEKVVVWWGPRGFTITTHSRDLRVGGTWVYTMHGPDGKDYPNLTTYHVVREFEEMVYDHGATATTPPMFRVRVLFGEIAPGRTKMDFTMTLASAEAAENTRKFIKKAGGDATWDRLAEFLSRDGEKFVINRSFAAPVERVFEMWTKPEHLAKWLPPSGMEMEMIRAEIRTGGRSLYRMFGNGLEMFGRAEYLEVERPRRLVYKQQFCDAEGMRTARHPLAPVWPETMLTRVEFWEEGPGQTRVTVTWMPTDGATAEEIAVFVRARSGMTGGWTGSFDKLEELLASAG